MYRILSDGYTVYDPRLPDNTIISGKLTLEVNKAGSLTFTIPKSNPHYGMISLMKSIVTVYDDDKLIFRGRPYAPSRNLYKDNEIMCEGELAFFNDTYQEPFEYYGTVANLFTQMIAMHNSQVSAEKQFKVGVINVVNNTAEGYITRSSIEYLTTWDFLQEKFLDLLGGYLHVRHEGDGVYIDYLAELNFAAGQDVKQGINLVDVTEEVSTEDLATVVIPLGAKKTDEEGNETDEYLTIETVNPGGKIYISDDDGVSTYGWIVKVTHHDDITVASNLLAAGEADLAAAMGVATTISLTAADLSRAGYTVSPFAIGTKVPVKIENLDVDESMLIQKLTIDLLAPESSQITVGATRRSFVANSINTDKAIGSIYNDISNDKKSTTQIINQLKENTVSEITFLYVQTDSPTEAPTEGWSDTYPTWEDGKYIWQKAVTTNGNGDETVIAITCLTGAKGATGESGTQGTPGPKGIKVIPEKKVIRETKVIPATPGPRARKGNKDRKEKKARLAIPEQQEPPARKVRQAHKVHKESRGLRERKVTQAARDPKEIRANRVSESVKEKPSITYQNQKPNAQEGNGLIPCRHGYRAIFCG